MNFIPKNAPPPTSLGSLAAPQPSFLDKVRGRFDEGCQAFQRVWHAEMTEQNRLETRKPQQIAFSEVRLVAFLLIPGSEEHIPLLSGANLFRTLEDGGIARISGKDFFPSDPCHFQARCLDHEIELVLPSKKVERYATNETLVLGNKRYLLKVLPKDCQTTAIWKETFL